MDRLDHQTGLGRPPVRVGDPRGQLLGGGTITCAWAWLIAPAANASRVASYRSSSSRASRTTWAISARFAPVNRAAHASVPVAPSDCATWRRSASATSDSRSAPSWASTAARLVIPSVSSSTPNEATGTSAATRSTDRVDDTTSAIRSGRCS